MSKVYVHLLVWNDRRYLPDLFDSLHDEGLTTILVTHDEKIGNRCERIIHLADGLIDNDTILNGVS